MVNLTESRLQPCFSTTPLRIVVKLNSSGPCLLPVDYRLGLVAIAKEAIYTYANDFYSLFFESGTLKKPYIIALRPIGGVELISEQNYSSELPVIVHDRDQAYLKFGRGFEIIFQSFSYRLTWAFYNYFVSWRADKLLLCDNEQKACFSKKITVTRLKKPSSNLGLFRTITPILFRDVVNPTHYLLPPPLHADLPQKLCCGDVKQYELKFATLVNYYFRQIAELANVHLDPNESGQFIFVHGRKIIVRHLTKKNPHNPERMKFTAFQGEFVVKGKPELLMALTVLGLGARRSQGFGLLELVEGHA